MQDLPVGLQGCYFLVTLALGLAVGILFDLYRTCRLFRRPRKYWGMLLDFLFCLVASTGVYAGLLLANWGEVRLYVFVGITLGLILYYFLLSPFFLWFFRGVAKRVLKVMTWIFQALLAPLAAIPVRLFQALVLPGRYAARRVGKKIPKKIANIFRGKKS